MTTEDSATQQSVSSVRGLSQEARTHQCWVKFFVVTFDTSVTDPCGFCKKLELSVQICQYIRHSCGNGFCSGSIVFLRCTRSDKNTPSQLFYGFANWSNYLLLKGMYFDSI